MAARRRTSPGVVEILRLLVILFFAGIGYQVGHAVGGRAPVLGPFDGVAVGVILGSGIGFVLGGAVGRSTVSAVDSAESALRDVSAEAMVASVAGAVVGMVLGSVAGWPLFLIHQALIAVPLFCFVVVVGGLLGQRLAVARREAVVALVAPRAGLAASAEAGLPRLLDTSVAVDGRVLDVVRAGFLHGRMLVAAVVLAELQGLADSSDPSTRVRGRRGLEVLAALKREPGCEVEVLGDNGPVDDKPGSPVDVDAALVRLALEARLALLTLDTNLAKAAALAGVRVQNLHALGLAMRPPVAAGDDVTVLLSKPGREAGQGVGYLDDGTMVVVDGGRDRVGTQLDVRVGSVLVTANGRMVFGEPVEAGRGRTGLRGNG